MPCLPSLAPPVVTKGLLGRVGSNKASTGLTASGGLQGPDGHSTCNRKNGQLRPPVGMNYSARGVIPALRFTVPGKAVAFRPGGRVD